MGEKRKVGRHDQEGKDLETILQENIASFSAQKDFDEIPAELKVVAGNAAITALLFPRTRLYEELLRLDEAAGEDTDSPGARDAEVNGTLIDRRNTERVKIDRKKIIKEPFGKESVYNLFNPVHRSTIMTKLDRMLLVSRTCWVELAEKIPETDQDPAFLAAVKLSQRLVNDSFGLLPKSERRDPDIKHPPSPKHIITRH